MRIYSNNNFESMKKIITLIDEMMPEGKHQIIWDRKDELNKKVKSGIYIYKMETDNFTGVKQMSIE